MPELPEVETIVRDLRPCLEGRRIVAVWVSRQPLRRRWDRAWESRLVGRDIVEVRRRGKWIVLRMTDDRHLVIHLGMTGQLRVVESAAPRQAHTHLVFDLKGGRQQLRFRDVRRFGSVSLFEEPSALRDFFHESGLGPEPFELAGKYWRERLSATQRCLKAVLLDQRVVAGVGNIYADEALFEAKLHPTRPGSTLGVAEADRLRRAIVTVLTRAIEKRGSSISDYVGGNGAPGEYQREFRVYGQEGAPCPRCRAGIERIRLAGRSTHFCPRCQRAKP